MPMLKTELVISFYLTIVYRTYFKRKAIVAQRFFIAFSCQNNHW